MADFSFTEDDLDPIGEDIEENPNSYASYIAPDMDIEGKMYLKNGIEIAGNFKGEIFSSSNIDVKDTGVFNGTIDAHNVIVSGEVRCEMVARRRMEVLKGGKFIGTIKQQPETIVLSEFATFGDNDEIAQQFFEHYTKLAEQENKNQLKGNKE